MQGRYATLYIYLAGYKGRMCLEEKNAQKKGDTPKDAAKVRNNFTHTDLIKLGFKDLQKPFNLLLG